MPTKKKEIRLAVIGCIHVPFTDNEAFDWAVREIENEKPTHLVVNGDLLDCSGISKHGTEAKHSLEDEIWEGGEVLKRLRQVVPRSCQLIFREGNHEQRIKREAGFVSTYFRSMLTDWRSKHREWGRWQPGEYEKTRKGVTLIGPFAVHHGHRSGGKPTFASVSRAWASASDWLDFVWSRIVSVTCAPMVCTGFSAVIGS